MIPKIIHYCWFGNSEKPKIINDCIESWRKYCPEYEIIEWNESNFDCCQIEFSKDAYEDKKWAFVSDYARLKIIYDHGGIYLDTDVLLKNSLNNLLSYDCWLASDDVRYVATGLGFGAAKGNEIVKALLDPYSTYEYPSGTNVIRDTAILEKALPDWKKSNISTTIGNVHIIGLNDYGSYAKHLYTYSWSEPEDFQARCQTIEVNLNKKSTLKTRILWKIKCFFRGPRFIEFFDKRRGKLSEKVYTFMAYDLLDIGPWYFIKKFFKRIFKKSDQII